MKNLIISLIFSLCLFSAQADKISLGELTYIINTSTKEATLALCLSNSITDVNIPAYIEYNGDRYTVVEIGDYCFYRKAAITKVTFDDESQIRNIGAKSFYQCTGIKDIELPDQITTIASYSFASCSALESVALPARLETLNEGSFSGCTSLTEVTIPAEVSTIGKDCFNGCSSLASVNFQGNPENIDTDAFTGCTSLIKKELIIDAGNIKNFIPNANTYTKIVMRRSNTAHKLATITMPFKPNKPTRSNYVFYEFQGVSADGVVAFQETDSPEADVPYVVQSTDGSSDFEFVAESTDGIATLSTVGEQSVTYGDWTFFALYSQLSLSSTDDLKHSYLPVEQGIQSITQPTVLPAFSAYFYGPNVDEAFPNIGGDGIIYAQFKDLNGNTSSIQAIEVNGIIDASNSNIYDLSGRRVNNPQHGIYIISGKKILF